MIKNKLDLNHYLKCDKEVNGYKPYSLKFIYLNKSYSYLRRLRYTEYFKNTNKKIRYFISVLLLFRLSRKYGWFIPINSFGEGLSIAHEGPIIVNNNAKIGSDCRIHIGVVIGTKAGYNSLAPTIGENCYIGPGAKIFGDIKIGDNVAIGANSVVNKDFPSNVSIAGVPAKIISNKGSLKIKKQITKSGE